MRSNYPSGSMTSRPGPRPVTSPDGPLFGFQKRSSSRKRVPAGMPSSKLNRLPAVNTWSGDSGMQARDSGPTRPGTSLPANGTGRGRRSAPSPYTAQLARGNQFSTTLPSFHRTPSSVASGGNGSSSAGMPRASRYPVKPFGRTFDVVEMITYLMNLTEYVTDQRAKMMSLLEKSAQALRTPRDQQLVATLKASVDLSSKRQLELIQSYMADLQRIKLSESSKARIQDEIDEIHNSMRLLRFSQWSDVSQLQDDISAIEQEIVEMTGSRELEVPHFDHTLHPVANLVFQKFKRLEEIVFLLKMKTSSLMKEQAAARLAASNGSKKDSALNREIAQLKQRNRSLVAKNRQLTAQMETAAQRPQTTASGSSTDVAAPEEVKSITVIEPETSLVMARYDGMLQEVYQSFTRGPSVAHSGTTLDPFRTGSSSTLTKDNFFELARSMNIMPRLLTKAQFEGLLLQETDAACLTQPAYCYYAFKRTLARIGVLVFGSAKYEKRFVTRNEQVKAILHEIDLTLQDKLHSWNDRIRTNSSGVSLYLQSHDVLLRKIFLFYAQPHLLSPAQTSEDMPKSILRVNWNSFVRFARNFGLYPHLLNMEMVQKAYKEAQLYSGEAGLVYPDFKQSFARLATHANPHFPSLDARSLFDISNEQNFDPNCTITSQLLAFLEITNKTPAELQEQLDGFAVADAKNSLTIELPLAQAVTNDEDYFESVSEELKQVFGYFQKIKQPSKQSKNDSSDDDKKTVSENEMRNIFRDFNIVPELVSSDAEKEIFKQHLTKVKGIPKLGWDDFVALLNAMSAQLTLPDCYQGWSQLNAIVEYMRLRDISFEEVQKDIDLFNVIPLLPPPSAKPFKMKRPSARRKELEEPSHTGEHNDTDTTTRTWALLKPDVIHKHKESGIVKKIQGAGFRIIQKEHLHLTDAQARCFFDDSTDNDNFDQVIKYVTSAPCVGLVLENDSDAVNDFIALMGPEDPFKAKQTHPQTLRAQFGAAPHGGVFRNAVHASADRVTASRDLKYFHSIMAPVETTFVWITPDAYGDTEDILDRLRAEGFNVNMEESMQLTKNQAIEFFEDTVAADELEAIVAHMSSGKVMALALSRVDVLDQLRVLVGPSDPVQAAKESPSCLRAIYGTNKLQNGIYTSSSLTAAKRDLHLVFNLFSVHVQTTFALIKPHAVESGEVLGILDRLQSEGFEVCNREEIKMTEAQAEDLCEPLAQNPAFEDTIHDLCSGTSVALVLKKRAAVSALLELVGPEDVEKAAASHPKSLRALHGKNLVKNAIHVSHSAGRAEVDLNHFFDSFSVGEQETFGWILPDSYERKEEILNNIAKKKGFEIIKAEDVTLSPKQVGVFFHEQLTDAQREHMSSGPLVAMILRKRNAIKEWLEVCGPSDPQEARKIDPASLRAVYGHDALKNAVYASKDADTATWDIETVFTTFSSDMQHAFIMVKPETKEIGNVELVKNQLLMESFEILQETSIHLSDTEAEELVGKEVAATVKSSKAICFEVRAILAVDKLRELFGMNPNFYVSTLTQDAEHELEVFNRILTAEQTTLVLVKPWAVEDGMHKPIIQDMQEAGLEIEEEDSLKLSRVQVKKLFPYISMSDDKGFVDSLLGGVAVGLKVRGVRAVTTLTKLLKYNERKPAASVHTSLTADLARSEVHTLFQDFLIADQDTFMLVKPDATEPETLKAIIAGVKGAGFKIIARKKRNLTDDQVARLYPDLESVVLTTFVEYLTSGPVYCLHLQKDNAILDLLNLAGPDSFSEAELNKETLRGRFGTSELKNAVDISLNKAGATRELDLVFRQFVEEGENTFAIIRPEALASGKATKILKRLSDEGFKMVRDSEITMTPEQAREFCSEQEGTAELTSTIVHLTSGPVIALSLNKEDAVGDLLKLCGDYDPEVARAQSPKSLRAMYGQDRALNAIYASSSTEQAKKDTYLVFHKFTGKDQLTFAWIKPDAIERGHTVSIFNRVSEEGFLVVKQQKFTMTMEQAEKFYEGHKKKTFFKELCLSMTKGPVIALQLKKDHAVREFKQLCGPTHSRAARKTHPRSLRALFGLTNLANAVHASESETAAIREAKLVFGSFAVGVQTTFAWIKPSAVARGSLDNILQRIKAESFEILEMSELKLTPAQVEVFYEKEVDEPHFPKLIEEMTRGPAVALWLRKNSAIKGWLGLCGPTDPAEAKKTGPRSLRALFGESAAANAVHASKSISSAKQSHFLVFQTWTIGTQNTFAWIKPSAMKHADEIINTIQKAGFKVARRNTLTLKPVQVDTFYEAHVKEPWYPKLRTYMTSGPVAALMLTRESSVKVFKELCGPEDPEVARNTAPLSIRALFGKDSICNALHASVNVECANRESDVVFNGFLQTTQSTFVWIQPDGVRDMRDDAILEWIETEGFETINRAEWVLNEDEVRRLVDEDVGPERMQVLTSGPSIMLAIKGDFALDRLLQQCGPAETTASDKDTWRAQFVKHPNEMALHCSKTPAGAKRELELAFKEFTAGDPETTFAWVKPDAFKKRAEILASLRDKGFNIAATREIQLVKEQASKLFNNLQKDAGPVKAVREQMTTGPSLAVKVTGDNAVRRLECLFGPALPATARRIHPKGLRALYGTSLQANAVYCSPDLQTAQAEIEFVFDGCNDLVRTFAWIKPDCASKMDASDAIMAKIKATGFTVTRQERMLLTCQQAMRFYAQRSGEINFVDFLNFMTGTPVVALELEKKNAVGDFLMLCGSNDPRLAGPGTLRREFGMDKQRNAVHASHNAMAAAHEVSMVFNQKTGFSKGLQTTFMWILPHVVDSNQTDHVIGRLTEESFKVVKRIQCQLTEEHARLFFPDITETELRAYTSGPIIALQLQQYNAVEGLKWLCGDSNVHRAKKDGTRCLHAMFGIDNILRGVYNSDSPEQAARDIELIFNDLYVGQQSTLAIVKPHAVPSLEKIHNELVTDGFEIKNQKSIMLSEADVKALYFKRLTDPSFPELMQTMTEGPCVVMKVRKDRGVRSLVSLVGAEDPSKSPQGLRSKFGETLVKNALHASMTPEAARRELQLVFDKIVPRIQTTLAIIKPHISRDKANAILQRITSNGFWISCQEQRKLVTSEVKQLYEEHNQQTFFSKLLKSMTSQQCIILALTRNNAVAHWKTMCGPTNPAVAKKTVPECLRAEFGKSFLENAVFGSASAKAAERELRIVFPDLED